MSTAYTVEVETIFHGRGRNECWFEPTVALVPPGRNGAAAGVIATVSQLVGNDMGPHHYTWTRNAGRTWSNPAESQALQVTPLENDVFEKPWLAPFYHHASDTLLMIGRTCHTLDVLPTPGVKGETHAIWAPRAKGMTLRADLIYSRWEPQREDFVPWQRVAWQGLLADAGQVNLYTSDVCQRVEPDEGNILCPVTLSGGDDERGRAAVLRLAWDGETLRAVELGNVLECNEVRGYHEPSLVRHNGRFLLTLRNDIRGYVAESADGLHFATPRPWTFDDGTELGSYNTQQHWLVQGETLFLVYTRRSDLSDGVVRHRAPLFMAEVDPERLCVRRATERVLIPGRGARMGNFCTLNVSADEAWVVTGEWLQRVVPGYAKGMPFFVDAARGDSPYNRIQYIGDLLLARVRFGG
ncbi:MAG: hypothetical protein A3K19_03215 [Lentisphaerae bacterium RIFOXYB12_FULL_65_16]|nr:MAG: hypothetical protein A3K18_32015 [Lentisphaerae bacterium RIFOXYA12_64_32]OGV92186.1 MAG: hypothetical protein A3K19_03215 [Lentisphaerae bacterium RIFOXYB12_FULL_65_16]